MLDWIADHIFGRAYRRTWREISARRPYIFQYGYQLACALTQIGTAERDRWSKCLFTVEADGIHVYPRTAHMETHLHFAPDTLRWFGRPEKYQDNINEIWLHFEISGRWQLLKIRNHKFGTQGTIAAIKRLATETQVKAYRRQRPYIHHYATGAHLAEQNLHGAWTTQPESYNLYVMPLFLVIFAGNDRGKIIRILPLEHLQKIEVMHRKDDPMAGGVVRFRVVNDQGSEAIAYSLPDYAALGSALAEAAKRTLEEPPIFYSKKKKELEMDLDWDE